MQTKKILTKKQQKKVNIYIHTKFLHNENNILQGFSKNKKMQTGVGKAINLKWKNTTANTQWEV